MQIMLDKFSLTVNQLGTIKNTGRDKYYKYLVTNLNNLAENLFSNEGFQRGKLLNHWQTILGEKISRHAYPKRIKDDTLIVTCASPIWAQEISLQQKLILKRFNEYMPANRQLAHIRCYVGNIKRPSLPSVKRKPNLPQIQLNEDEEQRVKEFAESLGDSDMRALALKVYRQSIIRRRQLLQQGAVICAICQTPTFEGNICLECRRRARAVLRTQVIQLLNDKPWLSYQSLLSIFPQLELSDYIDYHQALTSRWRDGIHLQMKSLSEGEILPDSLQVQMIKLVSLIMSKPYSELSDGDVLYALWKKYGKALLTKRAPKPPAPKESPQAQSSHS